MTNIVLARGGATCWRVVAKHDATACELFAAQEFVRLFEQLTGAQLPLTDDSKPQTDNEIVIGRGSRMPAGELAPVGQGRFDEDLSIAVAPGQLYIAGAGARGTLYGVYCFFEKFAGVRYVSAERVYVPRRADFELPCGAWHMAPSLQLRMHSFASSFDPAFMSYNRINVSRGEADPKYGLPGESKYYIGHSIAEFVPESMFAEHPEYFPERGGVRETGRHHQRCLCNPDVLRLTIEEVRRTLREHPDQQTIAIGQNDTYPDAPNNCQCPLCRAIDEEEGTPMGSLLRFVNAVAEALEPEFPDVVFNTLAYRYTRKAPRITRPRHNVSIVLCSIECCFSHPMLPDCGADYHDGPIGQVSNSEFVRDLTEWARIADKLFIWDYVTNFVHYLAPHPNLHTLAPNLRLFMDSHAYGYYPEGAHNCLGAELDELRSYVLGQLMWNREEDEQLLIDEYLIGRIGMAAAPVGRYLRDLTDRVNRQHYHMSTYAPPTKELFSPEWLQQACALFDRAEKLAPDAEALRVVQRMRMSVRYIKLLLYDVDLPADERRAIADEFLADMPRLGVEYLNEVRTPPAEHVAKLLDL